MEYDSEHGVNVAECLALAAFLEALPPERFDMTRWCGSAACMGGWQAIRLGYESFDAEGAEAAVYASLGISESASDDLFIWVNGGPDLNEVTKKQAARVLRHLAATGEVDWSVALEPIQ